MNNKVIFSKILRPLIGLSGFKIKEYHFVCHKTEDDDYSKSFSEMSWLIRRFTILAV